MRKRILLLVIGLTGIILAAQAQGNKVQALSSRQTEIPLAEALKKIEAESEYSFIFTYDDLKDYKTRTDVSGKTEEEALSILLGDLPLKYTFKNGCYIIRKTNVEHPSNPLPTQTGKLNIANQITGRILNNKQEPIEAALIWLIDAETSQSISQAITDINGSFALPTADRTVKLTVTCLGYSPYVSESFHAASPRQYPPITLDDKNLVLEDVVVIGQKARPIIEQKAGTLIFNVENSINAQGSNAFEILRQTPGVTIDEGSKSISINGRSGILVMLNGKQTYMQQAEVVDLLKSTSSSNIKRIEVMSNASAQYDAAGSGGILNIVLKRDRDAGYNMTANVGASYWLHFKQNTELSFNYNHDKINLYGSYGHDIGHVGLFYGSDRKQAGKLFESRSDDTDKRNSAAATLGLDYEINKNHQIGIQGNGNFLFGPGLIQTHTNIYDSYDKTNLLYSIHSQSDYFHQTANRYNLNFNYRYQVPDERSFSFDVDYGWFSGNSKNNQPNAYYSPENVLDSTLNYHSTGNRDIHLYAISSDYKQTLGPGEWMAGVKYSNVSSHNTYDLFNRKDGNLKIDKEMSNNFRYTESILAAYLLYDFCLSERWSSRIGTRVEYTHSNGHLIPISGSSQQESEAKKGYVDFFPSASVTFHPLEKHTISLSYGKRIDRPIYSDLNPIEQPLDGLASWKGNPFLDPQKTHRISLQYQYDNTSVELSYSKTNDYRVQITDTLGVDKIIMQPKNLGTQSYYGLAIFQSVRLLQAWNLNFSGRVYHLDNRISFDSKRFFHKRRWAGGVSLTTSFPLFWGIRSEILGVYSTKRLGGSTEVLGANGLVNIGFQKKFLRDKATVKLALSDLFWTSNWDNVNQTDAFESADYGHGETRLVKINFTYKFGGSDKRHSKKSNVESELNRF